MMPIQIALCSRWPIVCESTTIATAFHKARKTVQFMFVVRCVLFARLFHLFSFLSILVYECACACVRLYLFVFVMFIFCVCIFSLLPLLFLECQTRFSSLLFLCLFGNLISEGDYDIQIQLYDKLPNWFADKRIWWNVSICNKIKKKMNTILILGSLELFLWIFFSTNSKGKKNCCVHYRALNK